ncbi:MAG TPA: DNA primase [Stellaceae bacterium]|nr:DNA primase [Stellaceae bacterium]
MAFPPGFLDELRSRVSLADLVGKRVKLARKGREYGGLCPFHNEKTPSFYVVEDKQFFHCFAGETLVTTADGPVLIAELAGRTATILTRGGRWQAAQFRSFGLQQLRRIELSRNGVRKVLHATSGHRWFVRGRSSAAVTTELRPGHRLESVWPVKRTRWDLDPAGVRHGIVFGDGSVQRKAGAGYGTVNLHASKADDLAIWFRGYQPSSRIRDGGQEYVRAYGGRDFEHMKCLPPATADEDYLLGFIAGYLATDGHVAKDGTVMLHSTDAKALDGIRYIAERLGIGTFGVTTQQRRGYLSKDTPIARIHFVNGTLAPEFFLRSEAQERFKASSKRFERLRWAVQSVTETDRVEEVFCAEVPGEHAFALADNILTGNCFGCGAHGDAIGFVMRSENLDFIEAIERLAGLAGVAVPQQTPQEREKAQRQKTLLEALAAAAGFYEERLWSPAGRAGREYLAARGLDEETMRRFRLGWAGEDRNALRRALSPEFPLPLLLEAGLLHASDRGGEPYDFFRERVIFPIGDRAGRVIAFGGRALGPNGAAGAPPKYLNSPEHPLFEKGRVLYGLSAARVALGALGSARETEAGGAGAIVTEGYMDVIALHRAGFTTAVAPLGTALTEAHLTELWRLAPEPVLCFDGDAAGERAALRALHRALPLLKPGRSLRFVTLPAGEDPDSLIANSGAAAFADLLRVAKPLAEVLWQIELAARSIETPERRADLEHRLMAHAGQIADRSVQAEYRRFLRERLFALGRTGKPSAARRFPRVPSSPIPALRGDAPPPPPVPGRRQREVLLGMLLEHPFLVAEAHEEIAALDFPEPELDRLRRGILQLDVDFPGLDAEALRQHLGQSGFAMTVDAVISALTEHAGSLSRRADDGAVRTWWGHLVRMLRDGGKSKLASAGNAPAHDLTVPEAWERHQAAKEGEAQEGFSEDEFPPGRAEGASPR